MEIVVAVAAVALVAVGLAGIFDAVGKTVNGGKRVSLLNQYAGLIENQMRKDFNEMSRDGFLSIRQQFVDNNNGGGANPGDGVFVQFGPGADVVPVGPSDTKPRARRVDEIVFFARGKFQTARQPLHPDASVTSDTAMIYYGHGQRRRDDSEFQAAGAGTADSTIYSQPKVYDLNTDPDFAGREARLGVGTSAKNPNAFAGDWTLLRKSVLLKKPDSTGGPGIPSKVSFNDPGDPGGTASVLDPAVPADRTRIENTEYQIALQPAARSVFRSFNRYYPNMRGDPRGDSNGLPQDAFSFRDPARANLASGIVDIAATDLAEIRAVVQSLALTPLDFDDSTNGNPPLAWFSAMIPFTWVNSNVAGVTTISPPRNSPPPTSLDLMHLWMSDAFPTEASNGPRWNGNPQMRALDPWGVRARCELEPVGLLNLAAGFTEAAPTSSRVTKGQQVAYERCDQMMLVGSNFLPRCSEFAVDWSFGKTDAITHELIWHGPASRYDSNGDGVIDGNDRYAVLPYPYNALAANPANSPAIYTVPVPRLGYDAPVLPNLTSSNAKPYPFFDTLPHAFLYYDHPVLPRLIYGFDPWAAGDPVPASITSYFGFADPTYRQDIFRTQPSSTNFSDNSVPPFDNTINPGRQVDVDGNGFIGTDSTGTISNPLAELIPGEPAAKSIPWAWPKMVRVTVTLSDAQDPTIESTFQFIFSIPPDPPIAAP